MQQDRTTLIGEIRHFNRFYTRTVGLLDETLNASPFTLTEARVLFELGHRSSPAATEPTGGKGFLVGSFHLEVGPAASEISADLRLDPAYLTRILRKFAAEGLVEAHTDASDRRRRILSLTAKGRAAFADLQAATNRDMARLVNSLSEKEQRELSGSLRKVRELLGAASQDQPPAIIRPHRVGDIGWVIHRQAVLYAEEYGWDIGFEGLLAEIGAAFIRNFVPGREFCWVAERAGMIVGAVFLVRESDEVAKLRMLYVEPDTRGLGIGTKLVSKCVVQARACGYSRLVLWTNDILHEARRIYQRAGFKLVREERHHSFGKDLVGQYWALELHT